MNELWVISCRQSRDNKDFNTFVFLSRLPLHEALHRIWKYQYDYNHPDSTRPPFDFTPFAFYSYPDVDGLVEKAMLQFVDTALIEELMPYA